MCTIADTVNSRGFKSAVAVRNACVSIVTTGGDCKGVGRLAG
jgi:hypothetical protein